MGIDALVYLLLCLPLVGGLINGIFGKYLSKSVSGAVGTGAILLSFLTVLVLFNKIQKPTEIPLFHLLDLPSFKIDVSFGLDGVDYHRNWYADSSFLHGVYERRRGAQ